MITVKDLLQSEVQCSVDGVHWEPSLPGYTRLRTRLKDCLEVLRGNATAIRQTERKDIKEEE
jgi:hypothetical protein